MDRNPVLLYKTLVVGVTVLFIGIGVQPAIAKVEPKNIDANYYDINVEFCGLGKNHSVQLTQQQLDELELIFDTLREQLNNTESKEETIQIYNNAIERLDDIGLLGDYSVKEVQELVTGRFQRPIFNILVNRLFDKINYDNNTNTFCQIAGETTRSYFLALSSIMLFRLLFSFRALFDILEDILAKVAPNLFGFFWQILYKFQNFIIGYNFLRTLFRSTNFLPICLGSGISLGMYNVITYSYSPSNGWVHTNGTFGEKKWGGSFYGQILYFPWLLGMCFLGVTGFRGVKIYNSDSGTNYFLGFANYVNIDYKKP